MDNFEFVLPLEIQEAVLACIEERDRLRAENEANKQDAERYRWLCSQISDGYWACGEAVIIDSHGSTEVEWQDDKDSMDKTIDALRGEGEK